MKTAGGYHGFDDVLIAEHAGAAVDEERSTAEALDGPERQRGGKDIDEICDQRDEERVRDCTQLLKKSCPVVEYKVHAVSCCIPWISAPAMVLLIFESGLKIEPLKQASHEFMYPVLGLMWDSYSWFASISASSSRIYSESAGWSRM